jgi:hypothetical protein
MTSLAGRAWPHHSALCSSVGLWNRAGGLASATATVPVFFGVFLFKKNYQHCKRLIYTSCTTDIFIFKPVLGRVVFSLTFPWTGWFKDYRFWDMLQFFLPFNSRFLDVEGQKLCEKSALPLSHKNWSPSEIFYLGLSRPKIRTEYMIPFLSQLCLK